VQCETLSKEGSLELLLRTGGCKHLLKTPPRAAVEAIELCGRLPLTLSIAGSMIATLGTEWEAEICELLKDEFEEASVEERVVTASMRILPEAVRTSVEGLFMLFAVFSEEYEARDRCKKRSFHRIAIDTPVCSSSRGQCSCPCCCDRPSRAAHTRRLCNYEGSRRAAAAPCTQAQ
jgi:hypothetical protein